MKFIVCKDYDEMSRKGAEIIAALLKSKPDCVLGLATGSTPVGMYKDLAEMNKNGEITFKDVTSYNLDEYYPLAPDHDQSYRYFMNHNLGLGPNGHIAFNEPEEELHCGTHLTGLTESTIEANSRFFASKADVPTQAVTMGIGSIMKARKIIVLASGKNKNYVIKKMLDDRITTMVPATLLKVHPDVTVICDEAAYNG